MENLDFDTLKKELKKGRGISLGYEIYIDFTNEEINSAIERYNKKHGTNLTIKNIDNIYGKYGDLIISFDDGTNIEFSGQNQIESLEFKYPDILTSNTY